MNDLFGGLKKISIPSCNEEPCNIVQGTPLITYLIFATESPKVTQGEPFKIYTNGYITTFMDGYGSKFGTGLTSDTDLSKYNLSPTLSLKPMQVTTAKVPLVAHRIDPKIGPFPSTGNKLLKYMINVGNATHFITVLNHVRNANGKILDLVSLSAGDEAAISSAEPIMIAIASAIDIKFNDIFGGLRKISIPSCKKEPCDIVQGK
ncbi:hypothetical protein Bhyg_09112, partial [Pseudolycoriella hygida]